MKNFPLKEKILEIYKKDKKVFFIVVVGIALVLFIFLSEFDNKDSSANKEEIIFNENSQEYSLYLEQRVEEIVSSIEGAGKVNVMITISETTEYVYAQNQNGTNKVNKDSENKDNKSDFVIIEKDNNDTGLLLKTFEPKIRGVAIVCEGADDPAVQQQIYSTVSAVLNVSTARISISKLATNKE